MESVADPDHDKEVTDMKEVQPLVRPTSIPLKNTQKNGTDEIAESHSFQSTPSKEMVFDVETSKEETAPKDKGLLVYFTMILHGIGTLIPWNSFITVAVPYYVCYKLRTFDAMNPSLQRPTKYSEEFMGSLTTASQIPGVLLNCFNLFYVLKGGLQSRILVSIAIITGILIFTIRYIFADTHEWMGGFFVVTLISLVLLNAANGIYQNSLYGIAADLPQSYTAAILIGNNICGTFVTVVMICILFATSNARTMATIYFSVSALTVVSCGASFLFLKKSKFFMYYMEKSRKLRPENTEISNSSPFDDGRPKNSVCTAFCIKLKEYFQLLKENFVHYIDVFLSLFVTLASFPTIMINVHRSANFWIGPVMFTQIGTFLNFNLFAMIGSMIANFVQWPSPKYLIVLTAGRLLFIPFFLFCNYEPDKRRWPIFFESEYTFLFGGMLMALTSGYCTSLAMMYAPRTVKPAKAQAAGMLAAFILVLGICCGILLTFAEKYFMTQIGPLTPQNLETPHDICPNVAVNSTISNLL
ncbi:hypothetical protein AB6A40_006347 [Gnathostoma spinigerum]|uniref:Equilibrative nucleoside transporter 1 n=1 Tax=Gnathostoma spinigerum TaxID=75299 RepID=A0ABD6EIB6_9BILA